MTANCRCSRYLLMAAPVALICALSGCGSAIPFPALHGRTKHAVVRSFTSWDQCLRQHGVKVPVGFDLYSNPGPKLNISNTAGAACQQYLPPAPPPSQAARQKLTNESSCMRAHGFSNNVTYAGGSAGIVFAAGINPATPGFTAAMKACGMPAYSPPGS